jgi:diguanylate cyclase (GGDEF)-like protein/PAS domain S-box-containing protein
MGSMKKDLVRGHSKALKTLGGHSRGALSSVRQSRALRLLSETLRFTAHALSEQSLLIDACGAAHDTGGYAFAAIGMLESGDASSLRWTVCEGWGAGLMQGGFGSADQRRIEAVAMTTISARQPQVDRYAAGDPSGLLAVLASPIEIDGKTVGVFVLGTAKANARSSSEARIYAEIMAELGNGIQRQRERAARSLDQQALYDSLANFRTILLHQRAGILVVTGNGNAMLVNEAFCTQFGFKEAPAELENVSSLMIHARIKQLYLHPEQETERIMQILSRNEPVRDDEVLMRDGRVFLRDFTPIVIDNDRRGRVWQQRDVTHEKLQQSRVERLAFYDAVTGLPNRRLLFDLLTQGRARAVSQQSMLAVGVLHLNRFNGVNNSMSHDGGDHVLAEAAARIAGVLRETDVLARLGGDEFALLIPGLDSSEQLQVISRCILQVLRTPTGMTTGQDIDLSASIGWTLFPLDDSDPKGLIRHADLAMCAAREGGKDRNVLYEPAMELEQLRLQAMRERFVQALQHSRLQLLFQPIVYIDGLPGLNGVAGMEALLRLDDTGHELIEPAAFMHVLDDPQLARPIGRYVLNEALRCCQSWIQAGVALPVSINISTRHLLHPAFFADIDAALENYPDVMDVGFGIEVTETGPSMDHARAKVVIEECRHRGIRVGLDDFGTGSASLSHIQQLDIEHIKLDQSFVRDIRSNERNMAIAAGVITTARMLAKTVIAEGVETSEQGDLLASLGCHQLQGFSISRPMHAARVPQWVAGWVPPRSWNALANERQALLASQPDGH